MKAPITTTNNMATTGSTKAKKLMNTESPNSAVATIGLAIPPVVEVEAARVRTVPLCTAPAMPPPAITARVHFRNGSIDVSIELITMIPATIAAGVAIVSSR